MAINLLGDIFANKLPVSIEDALNDRVILEDTDMVVDSTKRIASRFVKYRDSDVKEEIWVDLKISYNAAGKAVKIETLSTSNDVPTWASSYV